MNIEWTNSVIALLAFASIAALLIGYFFARSQLTSKVSKLEAELELANNQVQAEASKLQETQAELNSARGESHSLQIQKSALDEQLKSLQATEQRLQSELEQHKADKAELSANQHNTAEKLHTTERKLESAQSEVRGLKETKADLQARLVNAEEGKAETQKRLEQTSESLAQEAKKYEGVAKTLEQTRIALQETKQEYADYKTQHLELLEKYQQLTKAHAELKTSLQGKEEQFAEQKRRDEERLQAMRTEFKALSNEIVQQQGKSFSENSQSSLDQLLKPFREQIDGFQKRVNEVHESSLLGNSSLKGEIKKVLDIGLQMSAEANNLTSALKGDSQKRGAWGEAQLRRTLEMSGLVEDEHFSAQESFKDADGKNKQTDYLIKLPDNKNIIIDSKVTLNAYDRAVSAETEEQFTVAMAEHDKAVRKHIDDLASKDYTNLIGMHSPSFVLMFMPIEPAYIEALKYNKDLFEYGYKKGIVLVSHTTLIPILRTVSNLWMIERSNAEAREISEKAGDIYNNVKLVADRLNSLGKTLGTASNHYNQTITALAGQQGLYGKVERFNKLSTKVSAELPKLEPLHKDFENERLSLIVEAIEDNSDDTGELNDNQQSLIADSQAQTPELSQETEKETQEVENL